MFFFPIFMRASEKAPAARSGIASSPDRLDVCPAFRLGIPGMVGIADLFDGNDEAAAAGKRPGWSRLSRRGVLTYLPVRCPAAS